MIVLVMILWAVLLGIIRRMLPVVLPQEELQVVLVMELLRRVAMDYQGNLACGTSTGGITGMENIYLL